MFFSYGELVCLNVRGLRRAIRNPSKKGSRVPSPNCQARVLVFKPCVYVQVGGVLGFNWILIGFKILGIDGI